MAIEKRREDSSHSVQRKGEIFLEKEILVLEGWKRGRKVGMEGREKMSNKSGHK